MNMLFFFMFSFIELPLCASRHFCASMIFLINAHLEEDVFIRREELKKVHRLLSFLDFKVFISTLDFKYKRLMN